MALPCSIMDGLLEPSRVSDGKTLHVLHLPGTRYLVPSKQLDQK